MTRMSQQLTLKERFYNAQLALSSTGFTGSLVTSGALYAIYLRMFGITPHEVNLHSEGFYLNPKGADYDGDDEETEDGEVREKPSIYRYKSIDVNRTYCKIIEKFGDDAFVLRCDDYPIIVMEDTIIYNDEYNSAFVVLQSTPKWEGSPIEDCVVDRADDNTKRYFEFVTYGKQGFDTVELEIKNPNLDLENNYNDDIPDEDIRAFITGRDSGLAILHGAPGTGKSTYIKNLIWSYKKKDFILLDSSVFDYITDSSFINLLSDWKNSVIILEDCESMLTNRENGNGKLSALLNLSDGIIGDAFNFKFICTFNAEIGKIDKALLRKGRMKIKYEFKKLSADKTKALASKLGHEVKEGESLSLADIYNYGVNNNASVEKGVGFK